MGGGPLFICFCQSRQTSLLSQSPFLAHSAFVLPELEFPIQTDRLVLAIEHHHRLEVQTPGAACNLYEEQVKIAYHLLHCMLFAIFLCHHSFVKHSSVFYCLTDVDPIMYMRSLIP